MPRTKNEVLTIHTIAKAKTLLKLTTGQEQCSAASMIEVLVLDYAKAYGLLSLIPVSPGTGVSAR